MNEGTRLLAGMTEMFSLNRVRHGSLARSFGLPNAMSSHSHSGGTRNGTRVRPVCGTERMGSPFHRPRMLSNARAFLHKELSDDSSPGWHPRCKLLERQARLSFPAAEQSWFDALACGLPKGLMWLAETATEITVHQPLSPERTRHVVRQ